MSLRGQRFPWRTPTQTRKVPPNAQEGSSPGVVTIRETIILNPVKTVRKTSFRAITIGGKTVATGERDGAQVKYKDQGGFTAKQQHWVRISGWKITKRKYPG